MLLIDLNDQAIYIQGLVQDKREETATQPFPSSHTSPLRFGSLLPQLLFDPPSAQHFSIAVLLFHLGAFVLGRSTV